MKVKYIIMIAAFVMAVLVLLPGLGLAYTTGAVYNWDATVPNYNPAAVIHPGVINTSNLVFGDFIGVSPSQLGATSWGRSDIAVGWDDAWTGGGNANTNGDFLDGYWAQIYSTGGWWDLGRAFSQVAVFLSQDHGPYLAEGLEYRIYGSNTLWGTTLSPQATLLAVYLDGWRVHNPAEDLNKNGWLSDDIAAVLGLNASYRYIKLVAWGASPLDEPEVDAIAGVPSVPVPAALWLLGSGLFGLVGLKRKFR